MRNTNTLIWWTYILYEEKKVSLWRKHITYEKNTLSMRNTFFMENKYSLWGISLSLWKIHYLWKPHIPYKHQRFFMRNTICYEKKHMFYENTHCLWGKPILYEKNTFFMKKKHSLWGKHMLYEEYNSLWLMSCKYSLWERNILNEENTFFFSSIAIYCGLYLKLITVYIASHNASYLENKTKYFCFVNSTLYSNTLSSSSLIN